MSFTKNKLFVKLRNDSCVHAGLPHQKLRLFQRTYINVRICWRLPSWSTAKSPLCCACQCVCEFLCLMCLFPEHLFICICQRTLVITLLLPDVPSQAWTEVVYSVGQDHFTSAVLKPMHCCMFIPASPMDLFALSVPLHTPHIFYRELVPTKHTLPGVVRKCLGAETFYWHMGSNFIYLNFCFSVLVFLKRLIVWTGFLGPNTYLHGGLAELVILGFQHTET